MYRIYIIQEYLYDIYVSMMYTNADTIQILCGTIVHAAIVQHTFSFATPEEAGSMLKCTYLERLG